MNGRKKIEDCGFTIRTKNALLRHGIETTGDLRDLVTRYGRGYLKNKVRDFGTASYDELSSNIYTWHILCYSPKGFNKKLYEQDMKTKEEEKLKRTIEYKYRRLEELRAEIEELERELMEYEES